MDRIHTERPSVVMPIEKKNFADWGPLAQQMLYRLAGQAISQVSPETSKERRNKYLMEIRRWLESAGMSDEDFKPIRAFALRYFRINENEDNRR